MYTFLLSQKTALERNPKGRRWNHDIIRACLSLYCASPRGYNNFKNSGFLILPSQKLLQIYKNNVRQQAGINKEVLHWMANEAKFKSVPPEGHEGGLIIDEMSIQPDLQFSKRGGTIELIGFTEVVPESATMEHIRTGKREKTLATHALQLVFLGFTGFRFPFAHFPTTTASGAELYLLVWKSVQMLAMFGFKVRYISTDGAQSNRDLMKLLLPEFTSTPPTTCAFPNVVCNEKSDLYFIMDNSHVFKKIRNNISKSGTYPDSKRLIILDGKSILWDHFKRAYLWDISSNPFPLHHKLSPDHFLLTNENKMRNELAESVLNKEMLNLMEAYKKSLDANEGSKLDSTITLLGQTSALIAIFRDDRPLSDPADDRLTQLRDILHFFMSWEQNNKNDSKIKTTEKSLISHQTREDIVSSILGFVEMCEAKLKLSSASIIPSRVNSDVVENMFCQQRTLHNGANTNPTYLGYCRSVNSVILSQATISRKANTGGSAAELFSGSLTCAKSASKKVINIHIHVNMYYKI